MNLPSRFYCAALTAIFVTGCGSSPTTSESGSGQAATQKLRFLSMDYDATSSALQKKIVDKFNQQNPNSKVEIDIVNWNDGHQKLQTLISGNQAPDLAIVGTRWMAEYEKAGLLADLSTGKANGPAIDEFVPGVLEAGRIDGKLVGLPVAASVRGLYYNKAMLKKAGVEPPKSWDEWKTAAQKIQAANPGVAAIGVQGKEVETDLYFYYFLWGNYGEILDKEGKSALASPAAVGALNYELGLVKNKLSEAQPTGYNREDLQNLFKAQKLAMVITGPWFSGMLQKEAPKLDFGVTFIPGRNPTPKIVTYRDKKGQVVTVTPKTKITPDIAAILKKIKMAPATKVVPAVADEVVMFQSSQQQDLAWKFLKFWYQDANRLQWAKDSGMLPEKTTVAKNAELLADKNRAFFIAALPKGKYVPTHPQWEQMATAVSTGVQQAMLGQSDSKTALQTASTKINALAK